MNIRFQGSLVVLGSMTQNSSAKEVEAILDTAIQHEATIKNTINPDLQLAYGFDENKKKPYVQFEKATGFGRVQFRKEFVPYPCDYDAEKGRVYAEKGDTPQTLIPRAIEALLRLQDADSSEETRRKQLKAMEDWVTPQIHLSFQTPGVNINGSRNLVLVQKDQLLLALTRMRTIKQELLKLQPLLDTLPSGVKLCYVARLKEDDTIYFLKEKPSRGYPDTEKLFDRQGETSTMEVPAGANLENLESAIQRAVKEAKRLNDKRIVWDQLVQDSEALSGEVVPGVSLDASVGKELGLESMKSLKKVILAHREEFTGIPAGYQLVYECSNYYGNSVDEKIALGKKKTREDGSEYCRSMNVYGSYVQLPLTRNMGKPARKGSLPFPSKTARNAVPPEDRLDFLLRAKSTLLDLIEKDRIRQEVSARLTEKAKRLAGEDAEIQVPYSDDLQAQNQ